MKRTKKPSRQLYLLLAMCVLLISNSGCSSIGRLNDMPHSPNVYGGTRNHIKAFPLGHVNQFMDSRGSTHNGIGALRGLLLLPTIPYLLADIPMSFVADTALLPVTIPAAFIRKKQLERAVQEAVATTAKAKQALADLDRSSLSEHQIQRLQHLDKSIAANEKSLVQVGKLLKENRAEFHRKKRGLAAEWMIKSAKGSLKYCQELE